MNRITIVIMISLLSVMTMQAQTVDKLIRKGNRQYRKGNYTEAEVNYRKALDGQPVNADVQFNLGDALFRQENYADAMEAYQKVLENSPDAKLKSKAVYNMGNINTTMRSIFIKRRLGLIPKMPMPCITWSIVGRIW